MRSLTEPAAAERGPTLATRLALFIALVAIWAAYSAITEAPVAIKHDMAEAYAWGQEFQLGYHQHPPFWAWLCGLWFAVFPRTGWAFALLSSLNAAIGLWGAWALIGDFAAGRKRMAAWVLLLLTPLYTFYAYKYDANIIFLSIWPWSLHYFMRSLQGRGSRDAIMFGALIGLALMSKYYAAILVATCGLAALLHPARRTYFASASPYVSAAVAVVVCAPHIGWLLTHRAPPLRYLAAISGQRWGDVTGHAAKTLLDSVGMNLGPVGVVAIAAATARSGRREAAARGPASREAARGPASREAARGPASREAARGPTLRVLMTLALAPLALTIASALLLRTAITPEMTIGTFPLLPLLVIEVVRVRDIDRLYRIGAWLAAALTLGALGLAPVIALARTYWSSSAMKIAPFQEAAIEATRIWHERTSLPLAYVAGSPWYDNAIVFYSPDRPHAFVYFEYPLNLWVTPDDLTRRGLLSVCVSDDSACLAATARFVTPATTRTEVSLSHEFWGHVANPVHFVITVIPPGV